MQNKYLAILVILLIFVSLISIFFSSPRNVSLITGNDVLSGNSYTSFNVTEELSILVTGSIDFGAGRVNESASNAIIDSALGKYNYDYVNLTSQVGAMPSPRWGAMTFDSDRNVSVLYGGFIWGGSPDFLNDTWEFDYPTLTWTKITSADNSANLPGGEGLMWPGMVYDSSAQRIILVGGAGPTLGNKRNETWEYDGTSWTQLNPDVWPPRLVSPSLAFDSKRNVTFLFGGQYQSNDYSYETWYYNYSSNTWTNITPVTSPPARYFGVMGYDSESDVMVLFGGVSDAGYFNDTWEWDYSSNTWVNITGISAPASRATFGVYDSNRDRLVVTGGDDGSGAHFRDTWDYDADANKWQKISDDVFFYVGGATLSYDSESNVIVIFAGTDIWTENSDYFNETWAFNYSEADGMINGTWFPYKDYFVVENDGTVNVTVNFTADKNAAQFIGGTNPEFQIKGIVNESGACPSLVTTYTEISGSKNICPLLKFGPQDSDAFWVSTRLVIPSNIYSGERTATITFTGRAVQ